MGVPYVWPWLPELAIFDLKIGFASSSKLYIIHPGKPPKIRFVHGFSKAGFGHASLFLKSPCVVVVFCLKTSDPNN